MAGLQRSLTSRRRHGSSGLALGHRQRFFSGELTQPSPRDQQDGDQQSSTLSSQQSMKHSRSDGDLYVNGGKEVKVTIAALKRSTLSFRRQGSSGVVWDDSFFAAELNQQEKPKEQQAGETKIAAGVLIRTPQRPKTPQMARTPQRTPGQSKRIGRYWCCWIVDDEDSVVHQVRLSTHRLGLPAEDPIRNGTKPRKDWHKKN